MIPRASFAPAAGMHGRLCGTLQDVELVGISRRELKLKETGGRAADAVGPYFP